MNDFTRWIRDFIRPGQPHELQPGLRRVHLGVQATPVGLTGNQAVEMACRLLECAGRLDEELGLARGDGTDALLTVLHGESSARTIGKAIGGSVAPMFFEAAAEILRLRRENAELRRELADTPIKVDAGRSLAEERALCHLIVRE